MVRAIVDETPNLTLAQIADEIVVNQAASPIVKDGNTMWNETAKANCNRDSSNADKSIALSSRHKVTDRTRTLREV